MARTMNRKTDSALEEMLSSFTHLLGALVSVLAIFVVSRGEHVRGDGAPLSPGIAKPGVDGGVFLLT